MLYILCNSDTIQKPIAGLYHYHRETQSTGKWGCLVDRGVVRNSEFVTGGLETRLRVWREVLLWCIALLRSGSICPHRLLSSLAISLELLHLRRIHMFRNLISLPLLEMESQSLVRVILSRR